MEFLKIAFPTLLFIFCLQITYAQSFVLAQDSAVTISVTGTSTLHGWTVAANEVTDVPKEINLAGENANSIENFGFGVAIEKMDGGRGASMNKKIMTALKAAEHPTIEFVQSNSAIITEGDNDQINLAAKGILKIAGLEKEVTIEVKGQKKGKQLILKGSHPVKFSELDIEPPSAMFGQIVCGDDIAVHFEFRYMEK